jgi:hypothetical protein
MRLQLAHAPQVVGPDDLASALAPRARDVWSVVA